MITEYFSEHDLAYILLTQCLPSLTVFIASAVDIGLPLKCCCGHCC